MDPGKMGTAGHTRMTSRRGRCVAWTPRRFLNTPRCTRIPHHHDGRPADSLARRASPLQPASHSSRRRAGPTAYQGGTRATRRCRRARFAAALYLAAAGVGTLGLVDFDVVDVSNLQRQVLHGTSDVGRSKLGRRAPHHRSQSARERRDARHASHVLERPRHTRRLRHRRRRHRQLHDALSDERRLRHARQAQRHGSVFRFMARYRCSRCRMGRAIGACSRRRRPRSSSQAARRAACSECCQDSSEPFKRQRR